MLLQRDFILFMTQPDGLIEIVYLAEDLIMWGLGTHFIFFMGGLTEEPILFFSRDFLGVESGKMVFLDWVSWDLTLESAGHRLVWWVGSRGEELPESEGEKGLLFEKKGPS